MKRMIKYFIFILPAFVLLALDVSASSIDNGSNENGKMVVSETLSTRCGLSSKNPVVTEDCLKRLASDYIHNDAPIRNMSSSEEFNLILAEYMSAYLAFAADQLQKSGSHADDADKIANNNTSADAASDNDERADIEANIKLITNSFTRLIDALDIRSMEININNVESMLGTVEKIANDKKKDIKEDSELRKIPSNGGDNGK